MTLHVFNPEHDIALAFGEANFTAPHAGRQLRHDLSFLPALWASPDDGLLVDDVQTAQRSFSRFAQAVLRSTGVRLSWSPNAFLPVTPASVFAKVSDVAPWGWDSALRHQLARLGVASEALLPSNDLAAIRQLSHRRTSATLLPSLCTIDGTVGEALECFSLSEVCRFADLHHHVVLKAPWSSSGRGIRFIDGELTPSVEGWIRHVLTDQGSIMAEPYYHKVSDFGMEFTARRDGSVVYEGLSLFHTANAAYTGNILATEAWKRRQLSRYVSAGLLDDLQIRLCGLLSEAIDHRYAGPLGVDMMVVQGGRVHPCVEINLRRTMGHVALSLSHHINPSADDDQVRVMRIVYNDNHYKLKIQRL